MKDIIELIDLPDELLLAIMKKNQSSSFVPMFND
jgi:hypothetical protein